MAGAKVLITGMANTGKTSLLKTLKDAFVVSRDGKPFSLKMHHFNVPDFNNINEMIAMTDDKIGAYKEKMKHLPSTIAFDSVSRIFTDIEANCSRRFKGFDVWSNVNTEISTFVSYINNLVEYGFNVVLIAHVMWDEKAGKFIETCKGSFKSVGGFTSTVDYALNIDVKGKSYEVTLYGSNLSRTLLEGLPQKQVADEFNLQEYIEKIKERASEVQNEYAI